MPAPIKKNSIDTQIYKFCNILSKQMMMLHPNHITYLNFVITFLLFFILIFYQNIFYTFIISLIRAFLDIFDGSHARFTNQCSKYGAFLDMFNDTLLMLGICLIITILSKYLIPKILSAILFIYILSNLVKMIQNQNNDILSNVPNNLTFVVNLIHDNTIIFVPCFISLIQYLVLF